MSCVNTSSNITLAGDSMFLALRALVPMRICGITLKAEMRRTAPLKSANHPNTSNQTINKKSRESQKQLPTENF
jgi:hypothetical protein